MARQSHRDPWKAIKERGDLQERHVQVAIDLTVRVTSPSGADRMRKAGSRVVADLNGLDLHLNIAHHAFSIHLTDHASGRYLGMVCHFNQCPKHKRECLVPGCRAAPFVRILPRFQLKPHRLNESDSQVLFQRERGSGGAKDRPSEKSRIRRILLIRGA